MELGDHMDSSNGPLMSIGRESYDLNSQDLNDVLIPGLNGTGISVGNALQTRAGEVEPWLSASAMNSSSRGTFTGESSDPQSSLLPTKPSNSTSSLVEMKWDGMLGSSTQFESSSTSSMDMMGSGQVGGQGSSSISRLGFCSRLSDVGANQDERSMMNYDFFRIETSSAQLGPNPASNLATNPTEDGYSLSIDAPMGLRVQDASSAAMSCFPTPPGLDTRLKQNPSMSCFAPHYNNADYQISLPEEIGGPSHVVGHREDRRKRHISLGATVESSGTERRASSRKRKNSMSSINNAPCSSSSFCISPAYGRTAEGGSGTSWLDFSNSHSTLPVDALQTIHESDEPRTRRAAFSCQESNTATDMLSDNSWKPSSSSGIASRPSSFTSEARSLSQISLMRNLSVASSLPQHWLPNSAQYREAETAPPIFGSRSWATPNGFPRNSQQVAPPRDRLAEMGRRRITPHPISSWPGPTPASITNVVENRLGGPSVMASSNESSENSCASLAVSNALFPPPPPPPPPLPSSLSVPVPNFSSRRANDHFQGRHLHSVSSISSLMPSPIPPTLNRETGADIATSSRPRFSSVRPSIFLDDQGEGFLVPTGQNTTFGMPLRGLRILSAEGSNRHRLVTEILSAFEHAQRGDGMSFEELVMLDPSLIFGESDAHDQLREMRLDVDNMSYEELLALEERIGSVNTGLSEEMLVNCLKTSRYSSLQFTLAVGSQESEIKCCICQEEYVEEDELARLNCAHSYHKACIKQWLTLKNQCPICKAAPYSKS